MIGPSRSLVAMLPWLLLAAVAPGWAGTVVSETSSSPYPGLTVVKRVESNPANRIRVAYVDLCAAGIDIEATSDPPYRRTPGSWGSAVGAELAVNGDFFRTDTSEPTVYGDAVGGGARWPAAQTAQGWSGAWYADKQGWIAFGDDWVEFSHTGYVKDHPGTYGAQYGWSPTAITSSIPSGTRSLVSGFPELVVEGQQVTCASPTASSCFPDRSDMRDRHPRTAMGLTEDRGTFILAVVDGRSTTSKGMYGTELAALMHDLGAYVAFNLDGGGSSAMWLRGSGYLNHPSGGSARSVANHWGIHATGSGDPGSCFVRGGCHPYPVPGAETAVFADLPPSARFHDEAVILFDHGITHGCETQPERYFCPNCPMTRAQAVTFLVRAAGIDTSNPPATPTFDDVPADAWFYRPVEAAYAHGLTSGCGSGRFCPHDRVTRGQMAAFLARTLGWPPESPSTPTFTDVPEDHLFFGPVEAIASRCVTNGCGSGQYCPDDDVTRGQAAAFLVRAFDLEDQNPCLDTGDPDPDTDADTDGDTSTTDTGDPGDNDTGDPGDTDTGDPGDTPTGDPADTGDLADTGETGDTDTGTTGDPGDPGDQPPGGDDTADPADTAPANPWEDVDNVDVVVADGTCGCGMGPPGSASWVLLLVLGASLPRRRRALQPPRS